MYLHYKTSLFMSLLCLINRVGKYLCMSLLFNLHKYMKKLDSCGKSLHLNVQPEGTYIHTLRKSNSWT